MNWHPRPTVALIVIAVLAAFTAVLGQGCNRASSPTPPARLRIQFGTEPVSLDPALAEDGISLHLLSNVMEGLVGYTAKGSIENRLAENYTQSPDGLKYEFTLRSGCKWSDGKVVTAQDFVTGLRRSLDPKMGSKLAAMVPFIKEVKTQSADGSDHLVILLKKRVPYFVKTLVLPFAYPLRQDILDANQGKWPESAPSTGSYRIVSHLRDQKMVLEENPFYCGPKPHLNSIEIVFVSDDSTALNLFDRGSLDILVKVGALDFDGLLKRGLIHATPFEATYYIAFNTRKAPFNDRDWRRAVASSIRKDEIVAALNTGDIPARSWVPIGVEGYIPYSPVTFSDSVDKVRRILKATPKNSPVPVNFDSGARNQMIMEKIQQDLSKALGLQISLNNLDWKTYLKTMATDASPIYRMGWMAPFMDPISHLQVFMRGNPNNFTGWANDRYDQLVREIESMELGPEREKRVLQAQKILLEDEAVIVPIYHYILNHAVSKRVTGFECNPFGVVKFGELGLRYALY